MHQGVEKVSAGYKVAAMGWQEASLRKLSPHEGYADNCSCTIDVAVVLSFRRRTRPGQHPRAPARPLVMLSLVAS
jgi:hypothetical protein